MLDDKLKEIIKLCDVSNNRITPLSEDSAIAQIKQAFIDEGYAYHPWTMLKDGEYYNVDEQHEIVAKLMTGQEWYDRFEKEYRELNGFKFDTIIESNSISAAKKAAGL